ncbi:RND efflux pump membrane fusion protein barrel-sandwich domain-containing protein [uncultured Gammaproteobacteria bacterium]
MSLIRSLVAVLVVATVAGGGVWLKTRPIGVQVVSVSADSSGPLVPIQVYGLGTVEARVVSRIGFEVTGTVVELAADHGDRVRKGAMLARLDSREQQARLARAEAGIKKALASQVQAEAKVVRAAAVLEQKRSANRRRQTLVQHGTVSTEAAEEVQANLDIAAADLAVAKSDVEAALSGIADAQAQVEFERQVLAKFVLSAPFEGLVMSRAKELGSVTAPGTTLFSLVAPETVWVLAYVDESLAGALREGQAAAIRLRSQPHADFKGKIARIEIENDRVSEERKVYITFDRPFEAFFLGEQAEVLVTVATLTAPLLIPINAIEGFDGRSGVVWTVENGTLARHKLSLGHRTLDGRVEVVEGITAAAEVVALPRPEFRPGLPVTVGTKP